MGVITHTNELSCSVAPSRMFTAMFLDAPNLMPKLMPDTIKSVEILEGDGGAGSVVQINFSAGPFKYIKHRTDFIDKENFICKYSLIEGELLGDKFECISHEVKLEPTSHGGCIVKMKAHFHCKGDVKINEEEMKAGQEKGEKMQKVIEAYLIKHPEVYA
ncbi:hypothetical protein GIB67_024389 [Kingdonia uniflora]|uniref:Bet v I/Major latex protein domain-containing protein n=1 Tax=Kingdonia uniflora TaxID=39325 RepID=A0A7J7LFA2_9MAGN|nr:hypothetical protein GIB67_024389 [Kingdonia uniflora]